MSRDTLSLHLRNAFPLPTLCVVEWTFVFLVCLCFLCVACLKAKQLALGVGVCPGFS
eukprot:m.221064 g.221064  ORF g.221064 m.221064 type:complete len:57 (+) comp15706_c0_seq1:1343-1513(+)